MTKKKRTRQHIIEDLSRNYFERLVLLNRGTIETISHDYGYDLNMYSYTINGEIENGYASIQLKATDNIKTLKGGLKIPFQVDMRDLELWLDELYPVFLILYDAKNNCGYWIYIQAYFRNVDSEGFALKKELHRSYTVHFNVNNALNSNAINKMIEYKNRINNLAEGVISHEY